jgi:hypothetical protein
MSAPPALAFAGGSFAVRHRTLVGPAVDLGDLSAAAVPPALLPLVQAAWQERVRTEFRSIQIMTRFLTEVTGAGDPLDIYASAADLVRDEVRHTELCASVCRALGVGAGLPDPVALPDSRAFLESPFPERALATALSMLVVNETVSTAFIRDLLERCDYEPIRRVLAATLDDESSHGEFGWDYARASLARFDAGSRPAWRRLVDVTLEPHRAHARRALERNSPSNDGPDEARLARFGLLSPARQAQVFMTCWEAQLAPRLRELDLLGP